MTTTNLHENKGVSTAVDNTVATAVTGATVWAKLTASNLTGTGNAFGAQLIHVQDSKSSGTAAQALSSGTWTTRTLNTTITNEIAGASLASNQITLPAGTYYVDAVSMWGFQTATSPKTATIRLRNVTDSTTTRVGTGASLGLSGSSITVAVDQTCTLKGRFTIAGSKVFELQMFSSIAVNGGQTISSGETELYTDVLIWKVL